MLGLFKKKKKDAKESLRVALGDIELPTFPSVVTCALDRVRDDEASTAEISDLLASDPGLSVRLLGTVNSAAFAMRHRVRNVHHAISLLGRNQLESLLISIAVRDALPGKPANGYDVKRFWRTAARRATAAKALAGLIDPSAHSESFTASLLQDLAIPLLSQHQGDAYGAVLDQWHNAPCELAQLERDAFGWDHAEIAGSVCREWGFPDTLVNAIEGHHSAVGSTSLPAVQLVAPLREVLEQPGIDQVVELSFERYQVQKDVIIELLAVSFESAEEIARMFV